MAELFLLRRLSDAPELYQLVATFGLTLALHDAMQWGFGVDEVFAPRFQGLKGAVQIGDDFFPTYQLAMIVLGPLVWLGLQVLLKDSLLVAVYVRLPRTGTCKFRGLALGVAPTGVIVTFFILQAGAGWLCGPYWQTLVADSLILMIFGISLQAMMALGGLVSFGHAAFFGLGAYGAALQGLRDLPLRAAASGLPIGWLKYRIFAAIALLAGLAGGLFASLKGAVFPSVAMVSTSVDALLVVLLGGVHRLWGAVVGSAVLSYASAELGRGVTCWRGLLGVFIMLIMVAAPAGLLSLFQRFRGSARRVE